MKANQRTEYPAPKAAFQTSSSAVLLLALLTVATIPAAAFAQEKGAESPGKIDEAVLRNLQWRSIGPAIMGGRIDDFAVVESRPNTFYVGAATGGVWTTTNNGTTF